MKYEEQIYKLKEQTRKSLKAFTGEKRKKPDAWIYFEFPNDETLPEFFDGQELFDIPLSNSGNLDLNQSTYCDEVCPLRPIWWGERLEWMNKATREFQCRFAETGDF